MITIRKAKYEDAKDLAYVHVNSWKDAYKGIIPDTILDNLSVEKRTEAFKGYIMNSKGINVLMYQDDSPVGFMTYGANRDEDKDQTYGEIWGIYLLSTSWHQGLGAQLIKYGFDDLKEIGYQCVSLWVLEENNRARHFYEKQGLIFDGTKKEINIGKPLIEIRYTKPLR